MITSTFVDFAALGLIAGTGYLGLRVYEVCSLGIYLVYFLNEPPTKKQVEEDIEKAKELSRLK